MTLKLQFRNLEMHHLLTADLQFRNAPFIDSGINRTYSFYEKTITWIPFVNMWFPTTVSGVFAEKCVDWQLYNCPKKSFKTMEAAL